MKRSVTAMMVVMMSMLYAVFCQAQIIGTGQLNVERRAHTATLLNDGKVLIVGGDNQNGKVGQAEVFDPLAQTSSLAASLANARTDHTATLLPDGRVLVIGGRDQTGALTSSEIYNPLTATFTAGPSLTTPRSGHTATVLSDGRILVAGGDASASAELYNPLTENFSLLAANMYTGRKFHSAIRTSSGQVLIVGGVNAQNAVLDTAEVFDPSSQSFYLPPTDMQTPRALATLKLLADGKVQIIGGDAELSMEVFDPSNGIFIAKALLPPNADLLGATLSTQSRAALFSPQVLQDPLLQGVMTPEQSALLNRADQSITELPSRNQALVAGGISSTGEILNSAKLVSSSSASITTDKTDYAPGQIVTITGSGFQPNEQVDISFHEFPEEYPDVFFSAIANQQGNFVTAEFAPQEIDLGRIFTLTAIGQSSGFTAQTTFHDANKNLSAATIQIREATCTTAQASFTSGTTVCAQVSATIVGSGGNADWSIRWLDPSSVQQKTTPYSSSAHTTVTDTFAPTTVGTWTVTACDKQSNATCQSTDIRASQTFTVTAAAATPTKLAFDVQPINTNKDATITPAVTVRILDDSNNLVTSSTRNVTLAIGTNPSSGTLAGTTTVAAVGGIATFSNLSINNAGNGYTLVASSALPTPALTTATSTTFNINKLDQTISFGVLGTKTYGDAPFVVSATGGASGNAVTFSSQTPLICTTSGTNGSTVTILAAGTCTIRASQLGNSNYNVANNVDQSFTINKATLTVTADNQSRIYGAADPTFTSVITGFVNGETLGTSGVTGTASCSTTATTASPASPPTYPITCTTGTLAANNYTFSFVAGAFTINKKTASVTPDAKSKTYGDVDPALTGTLTGFLAADGVTATYARVAGETVAGSPYHITATLSAAAGVLANYTITNAGADFNITARLATWTTNNNSKTYGNADPVPLTTGSGNFLVADGVTATYARVAGETVAGSPYHITATLSAAAGVLANYTITNAGAEFTIDKRPITVMADAKSKIYGDPDPGLTYQVTSGSLSFSDAFTGSLSRVAGELVGTYAIQQNTLSINNIGNYNLTYVGANLTITTGFAYNGFYSPIGGSVENGNGGSFANPVKSFKLGSTIPVKFGATWLNGGAALITGIHTLQAVKYSNATVSDPAIDATPTDSATTGNQFRLTGTDWHFNLSTKGNGFTDGTWLLTATLQDGSTHTVWITIKK